MSIVVTYCERVHTGFTGEPINCLSNAGYLLAAWLLYKDSGKAGVKDPAIRTLAVLLAGVGLGSTAYHSLPSLPTLLLDVIPILLLMLCLCWLVQGRLLRHSVLSRCAGVTMLFSGTLYLSTFTHVANGSLMYLPAALYSVIAALLLAQDRQAWPLMLATALLLTGLGFRTLDNWICTAVPIGTHFIWHLLTAVACYLVSHSLTTLSLTSSGGSNN